MKYTHLLLLLALLGCHTHQFTQKIAQKQAQRAWDNLPKTILRKVALPVFSQRDFEVKLPSGTAQEVKNCRAAIQSAIDDCHAAGGGRVVLKAGNYCSDGPIHLRSNVNLHLSKGSTLRFDTVAAQYLPLVKVRWEGTVCWNYSPLIYAYQQKNIALSGEGCINGQALSFWKNWRSKQDPAKKQLRKMGNDISPDAERRFGEGYYLRPSLIELYECEQILIEQLTLQESPFWTVHPVFSKNIVIRGLHITGGFWNDDGIDPDSCSDVLIEDCEIHTEDDAISIKAGRDQDAWHRPGSQRILVRRCTLRSEKANALCIGSELSGGVSQVFFEDCTISRARYGLNFKTNNDRGGFVRQIFVRRLQLDTCWESLLFFQTNYHSYRGGQFPTQFSEVYVEQIDCAKTDSTSIRANGLPDAPIERVFLNKVRVQQAGAPPVYAHVKYWIE